MTEPEASDPVGNPEQESASEETSVGDGEGDSVAEPDDETSDRTVEDDESVVDEELVERVENQNAAATAREIDALRLEVEGLEAELEAREEEIEEVTSKLKRKQADFENYKKRMKRRREEERQRATESLLERLLDVRDNLGRALDQDEDADIRDGVESTLRQFDDVLAAEGVERIEPAPGDGVDPHRHEVLARVDSGEPADAIAGVHRPGYVMGDAVLREAQVTVSDGSGHDEASEPGPGSDTESASEEESDSASGGDDTAAGNES